MTPEAKVKRVITNQLKELGAYYFYPATGGYGRSGVPDIVGCYRGRFFGIECKAGKNKPTALQQKNLDDIASTEGIALLINEANMKDVIVCVSTLLRSRFVKVNKVYNITPTITAPIINPKNKRIKVFLFGNKCMAGDLMSS